mmetsp:Transcript_13395/g.20678  ORF Transcript_13395/g.20678 Transcript_13395/m.20678 type:complete len:200 (+) Transcript_13395:893-1492(+)
MLSPLLRSTFLTIHISHQLIHILRTSHKARTTLMHPLRFHRQQVILPIRTLPPRMFQNIRHWSRLVHQLKVAIVVNFCIGRTAEDATIRERSMNISHHAPNIALCVSLSRFSLSGFDCLQVLLHIVIPPLTISLIATVNIPSFGNLHIRMSQYKFINRWVQRKPMSPPTQRKDQNSRRRIHTIPRRKQPIARLKYRSRQ